MRRIIKRNNMRDRRGRLFARNTERLADDGTGHVHVTTDQTVIGCSGCGRPITDMSEFRGRCDHCGVRGTCVQCVSRCGACSRRLCGACRRGFAGRTTATVCPICLVKLRRRQIFQDQLIIDHVAFNRRLAMQREWTRLQAMRLRAASISNAAQHAAIREMNRVRLALAKVRYHARRYFR